jgi:hypothetical protein
MKVLSVNSAIVPTRQENAPARQPADDTGEAKKQTSAGGEILAGGDVPGLGSPEEPAPKEERRSLTPSRVVINGEGIGLQFETDAATGTTIIRLIDLESGEVVRQIPPEEALNYLRQLEVLKGQIFTRWL